MTLCNAKAYLLLAVLVISALLSGCGSSSDSENIPYTVEVWNQHAIVFGNNSTVQGAGYNAYGQLGDGTRKDRNQAVVVQGLGRSSAISAGATHALAVTSDGRVMAWGFNSHGQLGNINIATSKNSRTDDYSATPVQAGSLTGVTSVAAGGFFSLAVTGGKVYSWGANDFAQLGYASDVVNDEPREITALDTSLDEVIQVAAGGAHALALTAGGKVWAWGNNELRQLGAGAQGAKTSPTPVQVNFTELPEGVIPKEIAAGGSFSLARMDNGTVWCWGHNQYGQTGNAEGMGEKLAFQEAPFKVELPEGLRAVGIAAGLGHALALMNDGSVMAWGFNERGQLGNNPLVDFTPGVPSPNSSKPVAMLIGGRTQEPGSGTPITGVVKVQAFGNSSLATRRNPATGLIEIWGWGDNGFGQLGVEREENGIGFELVPVLMRGI